MSSELVLLESLASSTKNSIVGGPFGSNLVSKDYVAHGVPVIRGQNMSSKWVSGEFVFVSEEKAASLGSNKARPGDLVFTQRGTLGQVAIVPQAPYAEYIVSQSQMKLTPDPAKADVSYLYYAFLSPEQQDYIRNTAIQTGVPHTNLGILKKTPIALPSLKIQQGIAAVLGSLDDRITLLRETNATLESIAQALFKSWFVDFDPVRAKQEGRVPEGMDEATAALFPSNLEDCLRISPRLVVHELISQGILLIGDGYRAKNSELGIPGVPFVRAGDLLQGRITPTADHLSMIALESARSKYAKLGDTAFTSKGTIGRFAYVDEMAGEAVYSPQVCFWRSTRSRELSPVFLHFWMKSKLFSEQVDKVKGQAAIMEFVSLSDQRRMLLDLPPPSIQERFEDIVAPLLSHVSLNRAKLEVLANIRDTLLPRLISGQLRLPEAETLVA